MSKQTLKPALHNIRRLDSHQTHGFQVQIVRQGQNHTRLFSDLRLGSPAAARRAAIHYRDALLRKLPPSFRELGIQTKARSNTGVVGVTRTTQISGTKRRRHLPCLTVSVRIAPGKVLSTHFFYQKGDYQRRLQQAIEWRDQRLAERRRNLMRTRNRRSQAQPGRKNHSRRAAAIMASKTARLRAPIKRR